MAYADVKNSMLACRWSVAAFVSGGRNAHSNRFTLYGPGGQLMEPELACPSCRTARKSSRDDIALQGDSRLAPQRLTQRLGQRDEHGVEADTDPWSLALVGIHRVRQPCGEQDQRSGANCNDHPIGVVSGQVDNRRSYDGRLRSRVMEIDGVGAILYLDIVDTAEEIVRVGMHLVLSGWRIDIGPAARNRDLEVADAKEGQHAIHGRMNV